MVLTQLRRARQSAHRIDLDTLHSDIMDDWVLHSKEDQNGRGDISSIKVQYYKKGYNFEPPGFSLSTSTLICCSSLKLDSRGSPHHCPRVRGIDEEINVTHWIVIRPLSTQIDLPNIRPGCYGPYFNLTQEKVSVQRNWGYFFFLKDIYYSYSHFYLKGCMWYWFLTLIEFVGLKHKVIPVEFCSPHFSRILSEHRKVKTFKLLPATWCQTLTRPGWW